MEGKQVIYLDFDNTVVNSTKAFCRVYNANWMPDKPADWTKVQKWDFSDECPHLTQDEIEWFFGKDFFFMNLEFMPDAIRVLKELVKTYEIRLCSIGSPENIERKVRWIDENITSEIPEITDGIYLVKGNGEMGKEVVNMRHGIIVDDSWTNVSTSNAEVKITFGVEADWNRKCTGLRAETWNDLEKLLLGER